MLSLIRHFVINWQIEVENMIYFFFKTNYKVFFIRRKKRFFEIDISNILFFATKKFVAYRMIIIISIQFE
jgi:hypothetical protein